MYSRAMMRVLTGIVTVALAGSVCVLAGCGNSAGNEGTAKNTPGTSDDSVARPRSSVAQAMVQGELDARYTGKASVEYTEAGLGDVGQAYDAALDGEVSNFCQAFGIEADNLSDEARNEAIALFKDLFALVKYDVGSATEGNGGLFTVEFSVSPLDIMGRVDADVLQALDDTRYTAVADVGAQEAEDVYCRGVIAEVREHIDEVGYLDAVQMYASVQMDDDTVVSCTIPDDVEQRIISYQFAG